MFSHLITLNNGVEVEFFASDENLLQKALMIPNSHFSHTLLHRKRQTALARSKSKLQRKARKQQRQAGRY